VDYIIEEIKGVAIYLLAGFVVAYQRAAPIRRYDHGWLKVFVPVLIYEAFCKCTFARACRPTEHQ